MAEIGTAPDLSIRLVLVNIFNYGLHDAEDEIWRCNLKYRATQLLPLQPYAVPHCC